MKDHQQLYQIRERTAEAFEDIKHDLWVLTYLRESAKQFPLSDAARELVRQKKRAIVARVGKRSVVL